MNFKFKQFTLQQHPDVFKFGTDASLLATWVKLEKVKKVLEIGTGTGVISFMMAQRNPQAQYVGIDISKKAIYLAHENLINYPIPASVTFENITVQDFQTSHKFDLIVSNPPFFENGTKSKTTVNKTARHTDTLNLQELIANANRLLSDNGRISFIYPSRYLDHILECSAALNLYPNEIISIRSKVGKEIKRILISIQKTPTEILKEELIIEEQDRTYTPAVLAMFRPFYLHL